MISGGKTLGLSPGQLADRIGALQKVDGSIDAAAHVLRDRWEGVLRSGSPVGVRTGELAGSIRVTKVRGLLPTRRVGTPVFYGRILHHGVPGRLEAKPHGHIALNRAEQDMNTAFRQAAK